MSARPSVLHPDVCIFVSGALAIINFNLPDIWQTVPDSWTINIKQNVRFQVGICSEKFQLDQIKNSWLSAIINYNMPDNWQTVPYS